MRQSSKVQGTKIAQAAKDLNVTSVTIRRYLSEFDIQTTTDANGIKVLPDSALEELKEVRRLKEDGLTNPKVMETLEEMRAKSGTATAAPEKAAEKKKVVAKAKRIESKSTRSKSEDVEEEEEAEAESDSEEEEPKAKPSYAARRIESKKEESSDSAQQESEDSESAENGEGSENGEGGENGDALGDKEGRVKHSLTCQTCSKVFEHMNPKLRDCLDCYRTKRKERRRQNVKVEVKTMKSVRGRTRRSPRLRCRSRAQSPSSRARAPASPRRWLRRRSIGRGQRTGRTRQRGEKAVRRAAGRWSDTTT